jgi:hypothetical protein
MSHAEANGAQSKRESRDSRDPGLFEQRTYDWPRGCRTRADMIDVDWTIRPSRFEGRAFTQVEFCVRQSPSALTRAPEDTGGDSLRRHDDSRAIAGNLRDRQQTQSLEKVTLFN